MTTVALLLLASLLSSAGQLCQKQAAHRAGKKELVLWLALAVGMLGAGMLLWLVVLQRVPVSLAYPMRHWIGIALIIVGILLLGGNA